MLNKLTPNKKPSNFVFGGERARLGHKNIAETLNTYSHMLPNKQDRMVKMLENIDLS